MAEGFFVFKIPIFDKNQPLMKSDSEKPGNVSDKLYIPEGTIITETLLQIIKFKQLNKVISEIKNEYPHILIDHILDELELKYEIPEEDLKNIPEK